MEPLSHIAVPAKGRSLLENLNQISVGESLFSDRADAVSYLFSRGAPLPAGTPTRIRRFATHLLGAASTLIDGWSILPPGVAGDDEQEGMAPPTPSELRQALGDEAEKWMSLAAWAGAEFTAQRALPLPWIVGVDEQSYKRASARWYEMGSKILAPSIASYPDHTYKLGIPDLLKRAAAALSAPSTSSVGPGTPLWQFNRNNRRELVYHMARRDAALVGNMFSLEESFAELPGASLINPPAHLPPASRRQDLHVSAIGIFELTEWPLPLELLTGSDLASARSALRRNALAFAPDRPHLREFLVRSELVTQASWTRLPEQWELASITLSLPDELNSTRSQIVAPAYSKAVADRFSRRDRSPKDYLKFRCAALSENTPGNNLANLLLAADASVTSEWVNEASSARLYLSFGGDPYGREGVKERAEALEDATREIATPENSLPIVRAALANAAEEMDGNRIVQLADPLAKLLSPDERAEASKLVVGLLCDANGLSPVAVGTICRSDFVQPHEVVIARLRRRVFGPSKENGSIYGLNTTTEEEACIDRIAKDLTSAKGVYYVEHRMVSILENGTRDGLSPDPALLEILKRYNPGNTNKGREKELRALFALIAAFDHERSDLPEERSSYVVDAVQKAANLREARHALSVSGQMSMEERTLRLLTDATQKPRESFAAGVAVADQTTLSTLQDAHTAKTCLAGLPDHGAREKARQTLYTAIHEYAHGSFQKWKFNHSSSREQIGFASKDAVSRWKEDQAWSGEALGVRMTVRESSDFGELLRHGDYPVKTCHAMLGYGEKLDSGIAVLADSHSKLLQFVDPSTQRIVGRSVVRMFRRPENGQPVIVAEAPYSTARSRESMTMRLLAARCLDEKFSGSGVAVTVGVCAKDRQSDLLPEAERHMGRMQLIRAVVPRSIVCGHYLDSNIAIETNDVPEAETVELACLPDAADLARDSVRITPLPNSLCHKDPDSLFSTIVPEDAEYAARCRQVFPDQAERDAYFNTHPDAHLSGTIPQGYEKEWRACLHKFPQLGGYLHHSEAVQSMIGGAPDSQGDGSDVRGALAVVEGRPHFRALIHGMSRDEIASSRELWLAEVGKSMTADPDRWPPEIDYQAIAGGVKDNVATALVRPQAFSIEAARRSDFRQAPIPGVRVPSQTEPCEF